MFEKETCSFVEYNHAILTAYLNNNLYELEPRDDYGYSIQTQIQTSFDNKNCMPIWHKCLGYKILDAIGYLIKNKLTEDVEINNCRHATICTK